ncbi:ankyrin repeat-containing domain protein [Paraphoma chrysanthemicola]|uniref:Ankyrin repeat-containing domain protein n=1 Tax=Paraphoma chrysanthemicola TaxID=798071 RepID=A0A8K0VRS4_9PLEO|nr:ankyrin repeat-containing domain protein [Paraphoma chrysanthemicola]
MEVVGAVASIVTLAALAKEVWTLSSDLLHNYQDAPKELVRISNQAALICLELKCISQSHKSHDLTSSFTNEEAWIFQQSLRAAKTSLAAICHSCQRHSSDESRASSRIAWTLFDRKTVERHLQHLQQTETSLCVILQVINIRAGIQARDENSRQNGTILAQLKAYRDENQRSHSSQTGASQPGDGTTFQIDSLIAFRFLKSVAIPESWKPILQSEVLLVQSSNEFQNAYELYARLPFFWFWGQKAFMLSTSLRKLRTSWPNFQVLNGSVSFCNIVAVESEVVAACRRGDIIAVRDLIRERRASPNDVSVDDKSLLWYAIESGSTELARFLINAGAPVRSMTLHVASYYRQPQIARLLLHSGADVEVLGEHGFTSAFFLFGYDRQAEVPQTEFLEILASNSFSNFNGRDDDGWSVLHRVAAFGTAADVQRLVQLKASVHSQTHNLQWVPIFCAVCFGNMETMKELWQQRNDPSLKDRIDLRGWNLLQVAAGAGNFEAVTYLLEQGVDLEGTSRSTSRSVPPALRNKCVTPSEVARNCGESAYNKWAEALAAAGRRLEVLPEDIDWATENVDGLYGGCECCEEWGFRS